MKKIYQNPEIKVIKIQVSQMITASPGYGKTTYETRGNLSRRNDSFWDDDEEDEEDY